MMPPEATSAAYPKPTQSYSMCGAPPPPAAAWGRLATARSDLGAALPGVRRGGAAPHGVPAAGGKLNAAATGRAQKSVAQ